MCVHWYPTLTRSIPVPRPAAKKHVHLDVAALELWSVELCDHSLKTGLLQLEISVGLFMGELPTNTGLSKSSGWGPPNFCDTLIMINMYIWFHHNRIICILYSNYIYIYITFEVLSLMCMQRAHRTPIELRQFLQVEILLSFYLEIIKVWQSHFLFTMYSRFVAHHARGRAFNNHKRCLIQAEFLTIQLPWLVAFSGNCKELSINSRFTL